MRDVVLSINCGGPRLDVCEWRSDFRHVQPKRLCGLLLYVGDAELALDREDLKQLRTVIQATLDRMLEEAAS